jgi:hypothetical protein
MWFDTRIAKFTFEPAIYNEENTPDHGDFPADCGRESESATLRPGQSHFEFA